MKDHNNYGGVIMNYLMNRNSNPISVSREFDSLFNTLLNDWGFSTTRFPKVDIWEDEQNYYIAAELSGYNKKDVDVNIDKHVLKISSIVEAGKEEVDSKDKKNYLVRERYHTDFERSFSLPDDIDEDNAKGEFTNGILTITMPKRPDKQRKKIEIKVK